MSLRKSPLLCLPLVLAALLSLISTSRAQGNGMARIDPQAVQRLKGIMQFYQNVTTYSDTTDVGGGRAPMSGCKAYMAWDHEKGLRFEAKSDKAQCVIRNNGEEVNLHWIKYSGTDAKTPFNANATLPTNVLDGTPFDLPGVSFICGQISAEQLQQLNIISLSLAHNNLTLDPDGSSFRTDALTLEYLNNKQQHVMLLLSVGERDNIIHSVTQQIQDASGVHATVEIHSNIQFGQELPDEYWTLDFPLMGEDAAVTPPPALGIPGLVAQLPTITAQDVNGKSFTVSPEDKVAVLFHIFNPGDRGQYIDEVEELQEEGEARGLQVVGIVQKLGKPAERTPEAIKAFIAKHHITFPVYLDPQDGLNAILGQLGDHGAAQNIIYGADGQLASDARFPRELDLRTTMNSIAPITGP